MSTLRFACLLAVTMLPAACGSSEGDAADGAADGGADGDDAAPLDSSSDDGSPADADAVAHVDAADAGGDGGGEAGPTLAAGHLRGRVFEALTLDTVPVVGAVLRTSNGVEVTTGADGAFDLVGIPSGARVAVHVEPPRGAVVYSSTELVLEMPPSGDVRLDARLLRGCSTVVDLGGGERARPLSACGARGALVGVELPLGGVVDAAGAPVARVRMEIASIPALAGGDLVGEAFLAFPGDMTARDAAGGEVWLESRGAAEVRLFDDATGAPARLAAGREATLILPAAPSSVDDATIRVWSYRAAGSEWVEEGRAELGVDAASGRLVTRMTVPHFSWWNSDQPSDRTCLTGRLEITGGAPIGAATMVTTGVDYAGSANAQIAPDGTFQIFARANSIADLMLRSDQGAGTFHSIRVTTGARAACTDLGTLTFDSTRLLGCTRGRVVDAVGAPIANADVTATQLGRAIAGRSDGDGGFCLPLLGGAPAVVRAESTTAAGAPLRGAAFEVRATAGGTCGGACQDLGSIELRAPSCIVGTISDLGGPALASLFFAGRVGAASARSAADGSFCATVPAGDVYRGYGFFRDASGGASAEVQQIAVSPAAGSCAAPATCTRVDLVARDLACVRGLARDAAGAPIAGATVRARPVNGTRSSSAVTAVDGSFCVAARTGERASIEIVRETRTTRDYVAFTADVTGGPAVCGGAGCADVGAQTLRRETFATCVRGRILDGGAPVRTPITASTSEPIAVLRPREDGRFCLEAEPGPLGLVMLSDPNTTGCARDRETELAAPPVTAPSCLDEARCIDVGTLDFADFCAGS